MRCCRRTHDLREAAWRYLFFISLLLFAGNVINLLQTLTQTPLLCSSAGNRPIRHKGSDDILPKRLRSSPGKSDNGAGWQNDAVESCDALEDPMERYVCEVEASTVFYSPHEHPLVAAKDISYTRYYATRDLQGWTYAYTNRSFEVSEVSYRTSVKLSEVSVLLCLGIHTQDKHCLKPSAYKHLNQGQRITQVGWREGEEREIGGKSGR